MHDLTIQEFALRIGTALGCGLIIGLERQWRQRQAGLRTYTLVATGAALFVCISVLNADSSPSRIAAQIVAGVGFLGAGVIMRSGVNVRGLNTAATIWCSAAVGTLAGVGRYDFAGIGASVVLAVNLLLRPLAALVNKQPVDSSELEIKYLLQLTCKGREEARTRALLVQLVSVSPLVLHEVESVVGKNENHSVIIARLTAAERSDALVEQLASRLSLEKNVVGLSWQFVPTTAAE